MRVHAVTTNNHEGEIRGYQNAWPHTEFFHGREGAVVNRYGERPYKPLPLIRNSRLMPPLFFPSISMIVNDVIAERLSHVYAVDLNRCRWEKVYDYPVDEEHVRELLSQFSPLSDDFSEWLERLMHPPGEVIEHIKYFEVLAPDVRGMSRELNSCAPQRIELPRPVYMEFEPFETCAELHQRYALLKATPYYLCSDIVYRILEPYLDRYLFRVHALEIR